MSDERRVAATIKPCPLANQWQGCGGEHCFDLEPDEDEGSWVHVTSLQRVDPPYRLTVERIPRTCEAMIRPNPLSLNSIKVKCDRPETDGLHNPLSMRLGSHEFKPKEQG